MPQNTPRNYTYPLYTDPADFPAQMQDLATDIDTDVQALVNMQTNALDQPSAIATDTASQAIASNTDVTLVWAVEEYDNAAMFTPGGTTFTVNELGLYLITAWAQWDANANATTSGCGLRIQSSAVGPRARHDIQRGVDNVPQTIVGATMVSTLHEVAVIGETISIIARHNLPVASAVTTRKFTITKISEDN